MDDLFATIRVMFVCFTIMSLVFVVLLAMPTSKLRSYLIEVVKYVGAAALVLLVISPVDLIPDVLPVLGWGDDVGYLAAAIASIRSARKEAQERQLID